MDIEEQVHLTWLIRIIVSQNASLGIADLGLS